MMIKEKLLLSNDYSSINKKCFSCGQFNHIIEECPKLHYVPNVEKIIKKLNYPICNERKQFLRMRRKTHNCLSFVKKNVGFYQKLKLRLKSKGNDKSINSEFSSDESLSDGANVDDTDTEKNNKNVIDFLSITNKKEIYLHSNTFDNIHVSHSKTLSEDNFERNMTSVDPMVDFTQGYRVRCSENIVHSDIKPDSSPMSMRKILIKDKELKEMKESKNDSSPKSMKKITFKDIKENHENNELKEVGNTGGDGQKINSTITYNSHLIHEFDTVHNFKNYFQKFNISSLVKNQSKCQTLSKEISKRYLKKKYKNFKNYTFYTNEILERFWQEQKDIRRNRRSLTKKAEVTINNINKTNYQNKKNQSGRIIPRKSVYGQILFFRNESTQPHAQIKSFGELINTILQNKRRETNTKNPLMDN